LAGSPNLGLELTIRHRTRSLWCGLSFQITQAGLVAIAFLKVDSSRISRTAG
jgi:hypothetical protein